MQIDYQKIFANYHTIAVVGLSDNPDRPSHSVANYLKVKGYKIIPVNPMVDEVLGEKSYASLEEIPVQVDIVDIFRRSEFVGDIVKSAIQIGAKVVWMQESVINQQAAAEAEEAGLVVVMDKCMRKEHQRLVKS